MQLKYQQNQQLEQVKNEIEEYRNMLLKDKWQQESQQLKNEIDKQKKKKIAVTRHVTVRIRTDENKEERNVWS